MLSLFEEILENTIQIQTENAHNLSYVNSSFQTEKDAKKSYIETFGTTMRAYKNSVQSSHNSSFQGGHGSFFSDESCEIVRVQFNSDDDENDVKVEEFENGDDLSEVASNFDNENENNQPF